MRSQRLCGGGKRYQKTGAADVCGISNQSLQVGTGSSQVQESAQQLASLAEELQTLVARFKV